MKIKYVCNYKGKCAYRDDDGCCSYGRFCKDKGKRAGVVQSRTSNIQLDDAGLNPATRTKLIILRKSIIDDLNRIQGDTKERIIELLKERKRQEMKKKREKILKMEEKYLDYLDLTAVDFPNVNVILKLCEDEKSKELWNYHRTVVSTHPWTGYVGRQMRYLVMDKKTNKILGIIGLGSDILPLKKRNEYCHIGSIMQKENSTKIQHFMNMFVCVSTYPFGMFTGGKLIALLSVSNKIYKDFFTKYGFPLYGVTTTSLYGKSIQYDRLYDQNTELARWKYLGLTEGKSLIHISSKTRKLTNECFSDLGLKLNKRFPTYPLKKKMTPLLKFFPNIGMNDVMSVPHHRGIYFCWLINEQDIFHKKNVIPTFIDRPLDKIVNYWKKRWFERRWKKYSHLAKQKGNYEISTQ